MVKNTVESLIKDSDSADHFTSDKEKQPLHQIPKPKSTEYSPETNLIDLKDRLSALQAEHSRQSRIFRRKVQKLER